MTDENNVVPLRLADRESVLPQRARAGWDETIEALRSLSMPLPTESQTGILIWIGADGAVEAIPRVLEGTICYEKFTDPTPGEPEPLPF